MTNPQWTIPEGLSVFDCDGYPLAYAKQGHGPTVLFVHGSLGDCRYWYPQVHGLSDTFRVIAVSLRRCFPEAWDGRGDGFSIEEHARDVVRFAEHLGQPVALVGFSRGGVVAVQAACARPKLFAKLVLVEPGLDSLIGADDPLRPVARSAVKTMQAGDVDGGLRILVDFASGPGTWDRLPEEFRAVPRSNAWTLAGQMSERRSCSPTDLRELRMPVLLLGGERGTDRARRILDAMQASMPDAKRATIAGAAHNMSVTHSQEFNRVLREFLTGNGQA
jgi:pimeloyl-ACP methyl ester carboxylesterase